MNFKISSKRLGTHSLGSFIHQGDSRNKIQAKFTLSFTTGAGRGKHKRTLHREIKGNPRPKQLIDYLSLFFQRFPETLDQNDLKLYIQACTQSKTFLPLNVLMCTIASGYSRACLANSSRSSSLSLFLGMFPTNRRWLLKEIVTPSFFPFLSSKSFN